MITTFESKKDRPSLKDAQALVGGLVEMVHLPPRPELQVLVNEEGLLNELPFTVEASKLCMQPIVGDVVVLKGEAQWD